MTRVEDEKLGTYVYCAQHVGPHVTGWCSVGNDQKLGLPATNLDEAYEWVKFLGLPIHGRCAVCYESTIQPGHYYPKVCPGKHSAGQVKAADRRKQELRQYLYYRFSASLVQEEVNRIHGIDVDE